MMWVINMDPYIYEKALQIIVALKFIFSFAPPWPLEKEL
jgi:hypothetical protein